MKRAPVPSSQHKYCADEMWRSVGHAPASPMQATARSTELRFYQVPVKLATATPGPGQYATTSQFEIALSKGAGTLGRSKRQAEVSDNVVGPGQYEHGAQGSFQHMDRIREAQLGGTLSRARLGAARRQLQHLRSLADSFDSMGLQMNPRQKRALQGQIKRAREKQDQLKRLVAEEEQARLEKIEDSADRLRVLRRPPHVFPPAVVPFSLTETRFSDPKPVAESLGPGVYGVPSLRRRSPVRPHGMTATRPEIRRQQFSRRGAFYLSDGTPSPGPGQYCPPRPASVECTMQRGHRLVNSVRRPGSCVRLVRLERTAHAEVQRLTQVPPAGDCASPSSLSSAAAAASPRRRPRTHSQLPVSAQHPTTATVNHVEKPASPPEYALPQPQGHVLRRNDAALASATAPASSLQDIVRSVRSRGQDPAMGLDMRTALGRIRSVYLSKVGMLSSSTKQELRVVADQLARQREAGCLDAEGVAALDVWAPGAK